MKSKALVALLLVILMVLGLAVVYWWSAPRLIAVSPSDGAVDVLSGATLRLTFSRSMQSDSVVNHLSIEPSTAGSFAWENNVLIFTPEKPWPSGISVKVWLQAGARASGVFSLPINQEKTWSFSIGQPKLAYLYPANLPAQIYSIDTKSGKSVQITEIPGGVQDFVVDANGGVIYFSTQASKEGSTIYRLNLENWSQGKDSRGESPTETPIEPVPILECPGATCSGLAISPKSEFLALEKIDFAGGIGSDYPQVWITYLNNVEDQSLPIPDETLMVAGDPDHQTLMPLWSNEGILVFFDVEDQNFVFLDPMDGKRARFPNQTGQAGAWHPNGRYFLAPEIVFLETGVSTSSTEMSSLAESHLILFDWQSGVTQDITTRQGVEDAVPAYSPDGAQLAFARKYLDDVRWTPGRQLWLLDTESGDARSLTDDPLFNHFDFSWSQSSDRLAYVRFDQSALTQPPEIWMIDLATEQATQLIKGGYSPQWLSP